MDEKPKASEKIVKAFILEDGRVIEEKELEKYRTKKAELSEEELKSHQLFEADMKVLYSTGQIIDPPYNLTYLDSMLEKNTEHGACVKQKAVDVCGLGYRLKTPKHLKSIEEASQENFNILKTFFDFTNPEETLEEVCTKLWVDYEGNGNGCLEIVEKEKRPIAIYHMSSATVRRTKNPNVYVQVRDQKKRFFLRYGSITPDVDKKWIEEKFVDIKNKELFSDHKILHIINYTPKSSWYGLPDWLPSLSAILGNIQNSDYNLDFFENNAIPHYAVIIKGADLDPDVESVIKTFFSQEIRGHSHKTLVVAVDDKEVEVVFEKLAVEIKDASFRMYRQDNRDEIIRAHRVPFSRINVSIPGKLGGGGVALEETETYKKSIIRPKQKILEHRFNQFIINRGFGIKDWTFEFERLDPTDEETDMKTHTTYVKAGVKSINEVRKDLDLAPTEAGEYPFVNTSIGLMYIKDLPKSSDMETTMQSLNQEMFGKYMEDFKKELLGIFTKEKESELSLKKIAQKAIGLILRKKI